MASCVAVLHSKDLKTYMRWGAAPNPASVPPLDHVPQEGLWPLLSGVRARCWIIKDLSDRLYAWNVHRPIIEL